ncbi:hypothetical protein [Actinoplanes sp. NPDC020271]|uniref:hypothetical protein n=1 Tax=Actinoplanes sp. NPDC020271 TaxID=3363896 RepID=UPI0037A17636
MRSIKSEECADVVAELARKALTTLTLLGFHASLDDYSAPHDEVGVIVEVDTSMDEAGQVFVYWKASKEWMRAVRQSLDGVGISGPLFRAQVEIRSTQLETLAKVLAVAGFQVEDAGDFRDRQLRILGVTGETLDQLVKA